MSHSKNERPLQKFVVKEGTALGLEVVGAALSVCAGYLVTGSVNARLGRAESSRWVCFVDVGESALSLRERVRPRPSPGIRSEPSRLPSSGTEAWCACANPPQDSVKGGGKLVF